MSPYLQALREKIGHDLLLAPSVAAVIRNDAGEILLQQRSDNYAWEIPAGGVDPDEAPAQAVVREVFEETGLRVVPLRVLAVVGGALEARDGEALAFRYTQPAELPPQFIFPPHVFGADFTGVYFAWDESWLEALR